MQCKKVHVLRIWVPSLQSIESDLQAFNNLKFKWLALLLCLSSPGVYSALDGILLAYNIYMVHKFLSVQNISLFTLWSWAISIYWAFFTNHVSWCISACLDLVSFVFDALSSLIISESEGFCIISPCFLLIYFWLSVSLFKFCAKNNNSFKLFLWYVQLFTGLYAIWEKVMPFGCDDYYL